jgi:hypothetical protein
MYDGVEKLDLQHGDAGFLAVHHLVWAKTHLFFEIALGKEFLVY